MYVAMIPVKLEKTPYLESGKQVQAAKISIVLVEPGAHVRCRRCFQPIPYHGPGSWDNPRRVQFGLTQQDKGVRYSVGVYAMKTVEYSQSCCIG
jgi:hypothetical protein